MATCLFRRQQGHFITRLKPFYTHNHNMLIYLCVASTDFFIMEFCLYKKNPTSETGMVYVFIYRFFFLLKTHILIIIVTSCKPKAEVHKRGVFIMTMNVWSFLPNRIIICDFWSWLKCVSCMEYYLRAT